MAKKVSKKNVAQPVKVKILREVAVSNLRTCEVYRIGESGKQVEMSEKDQNLITKTFAQMLKVQEILKNYYDKN